MWGPAQVEILMKKGGKSQDNVPIKEFIDLKGLTYTFPQVSQLIMCQTGAFSGRLIKETVSHFYYQNSLRESYPPGPQINLLKYLRTYSH